MAALFLAVVAAPSVARAQVELIVRFKEGATSPVAQTLARSPTGGPLRPDDASARAVLKRVQRARSIFPERPFLSPDGGGSRPGRAYTLAVSDSTAFKKLEARLKGLSEVAYVQANHRYQVERTTGRRRRRVRSTSLRRGGAANDPLLDSLDYFSAIRVQEAWARTTGSGDVTVGIVDTGLFLEHPDLEGQVYVNPGEDLNGNGVVDPSDFNGRDDDRNGYVDDLHGYDFVDRPGLLFTGDYEERDPDPSHDREDPASIGNNRHGTDVAGVVAAARDNGKGIAGVAPGTKLVPLRALGGDGAGQDDDIAAAIVYAADLGVDVLNFSFGDVYYSPIMEEAVQYAAKKEVVMVASAGNLGGQDSHYPSDYPEVISVAQLAVRIEDDDEIFEYPGKYGVGLDLSAPGSGIYTTTLPRPGTDPAEWTRKDLYGRRSGSSFAAPQVAATAALLRSANPELSPEAIRSTVTSSAVDLREEGWDHRTGAGQLDVAGALGQGLPARTEITRPRSDGGIRSEGRVAVVGTAIDPAFQSFSLYYAEGDQIDFRQDDLAWTRIEGPVEEQVRGDTLALWNVGALEEGLYTLRLSTSLQDGSAVEERRRVYVDRSAPEVSVEVIGKGLIDRHNGVVADLTTDDLAEVQMRIRFGEETYQVDSGRRARRHGLAWADERGGGGTAHVAIEVTNVAGFTTTYRTDVEVPASRINTALFEEEELDVPAGYLLPEATDFDRDGLLEVVFSKFVRDAQSDTLSFYEWEGGGFERAHQLYAFVTPRDAGDTDRDGLKELLFSYQFGAATLLIEQSEPPAYPDFSENNIAFVDTTGLERDSTSLPNSVNGALLTDLDGDGQGEILSHNTLRQWRVLEATDAGSYETIARLENPTDASSAELGSFANTFGPVEALTGDFDGDGRRSFLVGDSDGDWILYEAQGDDQFEAVWTYETPRYGAGTRFAKGDFDGDGQLEFVTYTRPFLGTNANEEREPRVGRYYFWESTGDDRYRQFDSLSVWGSVDVKGAMTGADFDSDGRAELALVHSPLLYVMDYDPSSGGFVPTYYRGAGRRRMGGEPASNGLNSPQIVTADFDRDGKPSLVAAAVDDRLRRFVYRTASAERPPPRWVRAAPSGEQAVRLVWRAPGADSVVVYRGRPDEPLDRYLATTDSSLTDTASAVHRYALRAWYDGRSSPLSEKRAIRPAAPATVAEVLYPALQVIKIRFTHVLDASTRADQFVWQSSALQDGLTPAGLAFAENGRAVVLRFGEVAGRTGVLRWTDVRDAAGRPVAQTRAEVAFPEAPERSLIVKRWKLLGPHAVRLTFSAPLDPTLAADTENYSVTAPGQVAEIRFDENRPTQVEVRVEGVRVGPTGRENVLTVEGLRSRAGALLAQEGSTIRLASTANDLSGVYVYPNPYHAGQHEEKVTVAGLPAEARVQVLSVQGVLVKRLEERGRNGGLDWDLTDRSGHKIPAGVYLIRVEAPDASPVLKKAAIIR